jgi:hypothetical protein
MPVAVPYRSLVAPPRVAAYGPADLDRLTADLAATGRATALVPVREPADVRVGEDGRVGPYGRAFTPAALAQLCSSVGLGLADLAFDLAGLRPKAGFVDRPAGPATAARIVNAVVELRFRDPGGPLDRLMVTDVDAGVIHGFVGEDYQLLPNADVAEAVAEAARERGLALHAAVLRDRRLELLFAGPGPGPRPGLRAVNGEAGGDGVAVHAAAVHRAGFANLPQRRASRFSHAGKSVRRRLAAALARLDVPDPAWCFTRLEAAAAVPLDGRPALLAAALAAKGLTAGEAAGDKEGPASLADLFNSILDLQPASDYRALDRLATTAGAILAGRFVVPAGR